jgi:hypothetical protein
MPAARTAILAFLLTVHALAGSSADYSLEPAVLDGGGMAGSSSFYTLNPSIGHGAAGASEHYALRGGFSGMLSDASSLALAAAGAGAGEMGSMNERDTLQLEARIRYDDDTLAESVLPATEITWSFAEGPLVAIDSAGLATAGLATAGTVYQDTPATVTAIYQELGGYMEIFVRNLTNDDFETYASDGLTDSWQVGYFGVGSDQATAETNPDGDSLTNLQEFAFGTDPSQSSGESVSWSGNTFGSGGLPVPFMTSTATSFTFRAVFARRTDFAAAGLSYRVEFSGDLSTWRASTSTPAILAENSEMQVVSVPYPFFVNGKKARFFRVKVTSN